MKETNFTGCSFSNDIVPYMYGELPSSEISIFESHLLDCRECTDEFAEISNARYEVYDWKKVAFDPLPTPVIRIPFEVSEPSWIDRMRAAFAGNWAVPAMALASVVVVVGIAIGYMSTLDSETAVANNMNVPVVLPAPLNETASVSKPEPSPDVAEPGTLPEAPQALPVKATTRRSEPRRSGRTTPPVQPRSTETRATRIETPTVPRLNEFDEDEDTSLRLAELFEDIETSD